MGGRLFYWFASSYSWEYLNNNTTEHGKIEHISNATTAFELYAILNDIDFKSDNIRNAYIDSFNNRIKNYDNDITTEQLNEIINTLKQL